MKTNTSQNFVLSTALMMTFFAVGCAEKAGPAVQADPESETVSETEDEAVAELSAEELALVEEQVFCPVGGKLGTMGTPVKVMVEGKPVFICCEGCRGPLLEDPEKYLAELEQKKQEAAAEAEEATEETSSEDAES